MEDSIRLCQETALYLYGEFTPAVATYRPGSRSELEAQAGRARGGCRTTEEVIRGIARFTAGLGEAADEGDIESLRFGGTEEDIISRGSDWCTDVARVACVLCQVVGVPARIVNLYDPTSASQEPRRHRGIPGRDLGPGGPDHGRTASQPRRGPRLGLVPDDRPSDSRRRAGLVGVCGRDRQLSRRRAAPLPLHRQHGQRVLPLDPPTLRSRLAGRAEVSTRRGPPAGMTPIHKMA